MSKKVTKEVVKEETKEEFDQKNLDKLLYHWFRITKRN